MWIRSLLAALQAIPPLPRTLTTGLTKRPRSFRPSLEHLDDRALPSLTSLSVVAAPGTPPGATTDPTPDVGSNPQAIVSGDFNNDGDVDLATADAGADTVSVLLGDGEGNFAPATDFAAGDTPSSLAVGDFNSDGKLDLVTANGGSGDVTVLLGTGGGSFGAPLGTVLTSAPGVVTLHDVAVGDFNRDGKLDVAVTSQSVQTYEVYDSYYGSWYTYTTTEGQLSVLLGNGIGGFTTQNTYLLGGRNPGGLTVADFNGDGNLDVVTANEYSGSVSVLLGAGDGTVAAPVDYRTGWSPKAVTVGDFTGDGTLDLITVGQTVDVLPGFGDGTFQPIQPVYIDPVAVVAADFNGDGKLDVVTADPYAGVNALLGRGDATFAPPIELHAGAAPVAVTTGDFNGDGRIDLATANSGSDDVSVFLNDGVWPALNAPSLRVNDVTVAEGNTDASGNAVTTDATFTVTLSAVYDRDVTVRYATTGGSYDSATAGTDYEAGSGLVTILAGQTSATFAVQVNGDRVGESNESFSVRLTDATNAFIADGAGVATITDDESRISIDYGPYVAEGNTGAKAVTLTVRLSAAYDQEVRVNYSTAEGDTEWYDSGYWGWYGWYAGPPEPVAATVGVDFQHQEGELVFEAGQTEKTITVLVNGDRLAESDEAFSVDLTGATGAVIASGHSVVTISDDEPWVSVSGSPTIIEGTGGTKTAIFTVTLSSAYDAPVTVDYATGDASYWYGNGATAGTDYEAAAAMLTFAPNQTTATISVKVYGDNVAEYQEYFSLNLSNAKGAHLGTSSAIGTIVDDDPHLSVSDVTRTEGGSGVTSTYTFTVTLSTASTGSVTVYYATQDGSARAGSAATGGDYKATSGTLTFAPGETTKTVTVEVYGDTTVEYNEYFYLNLSAPTGNAVIYDAWATGTIQNDDTAPASGGSNGKGGGKRK